MIGDGSAGNLGGGLLTISLGNHANRVSAPVMTAVPEHPGQASAADETAEQEIVERIFEAVVEQRLPPGTKLSESALCEAFGVGRMRIRRALLLLSSREVVELHANRGAYVALPTAKQARDVFEARLALEPAIASLAVARADSADIVRLAAHLEMEHDAHHQNRRHEAIRLSGQFHILVAQIGGNEVILRIIKELVTRTSLIIGIFGSAGVGNSCRADDHNRIVQAFKARDGQAAAALMTDHLREIEGTLDLGVNRKVAVDLVSMFGSRRP